MAISLQVRGQASRYFPGAKENLTVPWSVPITVADLLHALGVDVVLVTAVVNGQRVKPDFLLADGDKVLFFSPMAGG